MKRRITDNLARTARCPAGKREVFIRDTEPHGFGLRVSPQGRVRPDPSSAAAAALPLRRVDSRSDIAGVNPAAPGGKTSVLPREVSPGLGRIPSPSAATATDARGEVSRGHASRPDRTVKGRILWCKEQTGKTP